MRLRRISVVLATLVLALGVAFPAGVSAQATSSTQGTTGSGTTASGASGSGSSGSATTSGVTTEETRSETGGSTARITRGGDPTTAPVRSTRSGEQEGEVPVNEEDDGRKADFIWLELEGGVSYVDLIALRDDEFGSSLESVRGWAPTVGVGLGFRIFFLALGARATFARYPDFELGTVGGEVQFRLPTPVVEPWIRVGAGYAWQGDANYAEPTASTPTVYGWMLNGAVGLDIFVTWWLTLGIGGGVDFLNMTRQTDPRVDCMMVTSFCPQQEGDAIGVQARAFAQAGLHF